MGAHGGPAAGTATTETPSSDELRANLEHAEKTRQQALAALEARAQEENAKKKEAKEADDMARQENDKAEKRAAANRGDTYHLRPPAR